MGTVPGVGTDGEEVEEVAELLGMGDELRLRMPAAVDVAEELQRGAGKGAAA